MGSFHPRRLKADLSREGADYLNSSSSFNPSPPAPGGGCRQQPSVEWGGVGLLLASQSWRGPIGSNFLARPPLSDLSSSPTLHLEPQILKQQLKLTTAPSSMSKPPPHISGIASFLACILCQEGGHWKAFLCRAPEPRQRPPLGPLPQQVDSHPPCPLPPQFPEIPFWSVGHRPSHTQDSACKNWEKHCLDCVLTRGP